MRPSSILHNPSFGKNYETVIFYTFATLIFQQILSSLNIIKFELVDSTTVLEILYFGIAISLISITPRTNLIKAFILIFIFLLIILFSSQISTPLYETISATKWLLFTSCLYLMDTRKLISVRFLSNLLNLLVISTFIFYTLQKIAFGNHFRPYLFTENNYEIALLSGILCLRFILDNSRKKGYDKLAIILFVIIIFLSGSRSGAICGLISLYAIYSHTNKNKKTPVTLLFSLPFIYGTSYVFNSRGQNNQSIDRIYFFQIFISEMQNKNWFEWIFGSLRITPISNDGCYALKFYQTLFADPINLSCYSVVFHSILLRILYDFGLIGLLMSFILIFSILRNEIGKKLSITLLLVSLINGASVSGINNVYVMFPIFLAMIVKNKNNQNNTF